MTIICSFKLFMLHTTEAPNDKDNGNFINIYDDKIVK